MWGLDHTGLIYPSSNTAHACACGYAYGRQLEGEGGEGTFHPLFMIMQHLPRSLFAVGRSHRMMKKSVNWAQGSGPDPDPFLSPR